MAFYTIAWILTSTCMILSYLKVMENEAVPVAEWTQHSCLVASEFVLQSRLLLCSGRDSLVRGKRCMKYRAYVRVRVKHMELVAFNTLRAGFEFPKDPFLHYNVDEFTARWNVSRPLGGSSEESGLWLPCVVHPEAKSCTEVRMSSFEECAGRVLLGSGDMYPTPSVGERLSQRYVPLILFVGLALFVLWRLAHETYVQCRDHAHDLLQRWASVRLAWEQWRERQPPNVPSSPGYSGDAEMVLWMPPGPPVVVGHAVRPGEFERFAAAVPIASGQPVPAGYDLM